MKKRDALDRLMLSLDGLTDLQGTQAYWRRVRVMRAVRALLRERAEAARKAYFSNSSRPHPSEADTVYAAVLNRPKKGARK